MTRMIRTALVAAVALLAGACDLAEVATAPGDDVVVVEAVLRTDRLNQQVLLHRSLQGRFSGGVPGARVTITGNAGEARTLAETTGCFRIDPAYQQADSLQFEGSCYASNGDFAVRPGGIYELRVETADGRVIRGRTQIPADFTVPSVPVGSGSELICSLAPETTFTLTWTRSPGAASYVADLSISGLAQLGIAAPEPFDLRGLAVSDTDTTIALPAEFGVFERFNYDAELFKEIEDGFPGGIQLAVALAAADRNWVNSVRGGNFNPSGLIRISTVVGDGVGVFGSLVVKHITIPVRERTSIPRCR